MIGDGVRDVLRREEPDELISGHHENTVHRCIPHEIGGPVHQCGGRKLSHLSGHHLGHCVLFECVPLRSRRFSNALGDVGSGVGPLIEEECGRRLLALHPFGGFVVTFPLRQLKRLRSLPSAPPAFLPQRRPDLWPVPPSKQDCA